jgi:hypothetical protein
VLFVLIAARGFSPLHRPLLLPPDTAPIVEHCLHVALDVGLNPGHRRVPVKILTKIGCVHRGQPRWWLFNLVLSPRLRDRRCRFPGTSPRTFGHGGLQLWVSLGDALRLSCGRPPAHPVWRPTPTRSGRKLSLTPNPVGSKNVLAVKDGVARGDDIGVENENRDRVMLNASGHWHRLALG